jgi:hypothetical protein
MNVYPNLAASIAAACDHCGRPARPTADAFFQAYRQQDGFLFLCAACVGEHHAAYAATRVAPAFRVDKTRKRSTW